MTEGKFSINIDLTADEMAKLVTYCQSTGKTIPEVGPQAIGYFLRNTAPELEKVLSID